jgi:outer membrane biogenesis lipoprotein LolB
MKLRFFAALVLASLAASCTPGPPRLEEGEAALRWQSFAKTAAPSGSSVLGGSLRFGPDNDTRRVTYLLWGNADGPLRLDVQAGAGVVVARARMEEGAVLIHFPQEGKAYIGADAPDKALRALGIPLPLSLAELNAFLQGRYGEALGGPSPESSRPAAQGTGIVYAVRGPRGQSLLELSPEALPVGWSVPRAWSVTVRFDPATRLPVRIDGVLPAEFPDADAYRLVLLIKERLLLNSSTVVVCIHVK